MSDSNGDDEGLRIGKGKIDFKKLLPLINHGVAEVRDKNEIKAFEMIKTYEKIKNKVKTFDKIIMHLPKSAEDFLDSALNLSKKGTIIHFYDFQDVKDFDKSKEKILKETLRNM